MKTKSLLLVSTLIASISLFSLQTFAEAPVQASADEAVPTEQSATTDAKTLEILLTQIESNELALYELFNKLNSSDEYNISCTSRTDENLDRPMQVCEPAFLKRVREEYREETGGGSGNEASFFGKLRETFLGPRESTDEIVRARAAEPIKQVQQEFETLASTNPALLAKLETIGELQQELVELAESARKDPSFMWQNEPGYRNSQLRYQEREAANPRPWFSAPPAGHTQPQIHFGRGDDSPH